ncbi:MAG: hypothetical protein AAF493_29900 [Pseudomonadota bacterium]
MAALSFENFKASLSGCVPPDGLDLALRALWWDRKGDAAVARRLAERDDGNAGRWVLAYLCRKAGESSEADYHYWRAGLVPTRGALDAEWRDIVLTLLSERPVAGAYGI